MNKYSPTGSSFPKGIKGRILVSKMNKSHEDISSWGLSFVNIKDDFNILDIGCGGGRNLQRFLKLSNELICGIDISKASISKSKHLNKLAYKNKRLILINDDIKNIHLSDESFNLITAFCTIKFFDDFESRFNNIYRMLKDNGLFLICDHGKYNMDHVLEALNKSGFKNINIQTKDDYVCILARK